MFRPTSRRLSAWRDLTGVSVAPVVARMHRLLQRRFPQALWLGDESQRRIALTFDDGPSPRDTEALLEVLAWHHVKATFFNIGEHVQAHPELVRAVNDAGHGHGLHGYRHRAFPLLDAMRLRDDLRLTQRLLAEATGRDLDALTYVRPPFGVFTPATLTGLTAWGFRPVMWTVVPTHWLQTAQQSISEVMIQTTPGSILVLHESLPGPPIAALTDALLTRLKERGFSFGTVDEMWQYRVPSS